MDDLWKKTDKELAKIEKKLEKIYQEAYKDLAEKWDEYMSQANSEVAPFEKAYQKAKESGDAAEIQKAGIALSEAKKKATVQNAYWQGMVNQVAERYEHINETALAYVNGKIPGIYAMNLNGTLHEIETDAGKVKMGVAFDMVDERTVRNLVKSDKSLFPQKKMDKAKDKAWNKKAINSQILQGILQGESIPKIAHRLQNITDMNAAAATRNARTMCTTAENNGRLAGLKEAEEKGIVYEKQWMSTHDDRTRASHQELDGVSVPVDEEFPNGLNYPGDPNGEPEEVYNCRCSLIRKLVGFKRKDGSISEVGEIHQYNPDYFQTAEPEQTAQAEEKAKFDMEKVSAYISPDIADRVEKYADRMDSESIERFNKIFSEADVVSGNAMYYDKKTNKISISGEEYVGAEVSVFHEAGHCFDYNQNYTITQDWGRYKYIFDENENMIGKEWEPKIVTIKENAGFSEYVSWNYKTIQKGEEKSAASKDLENIVSKLGISGQFGPDNPEAPDDLNRIREYLKEKGVTPSDKDYSSLSDFISAMTYDANFGSVIGGGHSYQYWLQGDEYRVAEITTGYNLLKATGRDDLLEIERELAPNLMGIIETEWGKIWKTKS